jgi:hypothetical protein
MNGEDTVEIYLEVGYLHESRAAEHAQSHVS